MYVYLSKILPQLVMPVSVAMGLILLALILLRFEKHRLSVLALWLALATLWIFSMPITAGMMYRWVESSYPARPLSEIPQSDCIVVLGGVIQPPLQPRVDAEFNNSIDRVYKAAQLYRADKARMVIVTAGNQPWEDSTWTEAELIQGLLVEWGVPENVILLEGSSRNTRENALYTKNIIDAYGCEKTLLVTSASHMPRSVAAFTSVGVGVVPVPTDFRVADRAGLTVMQFLPNAKALEMTSSAIREWIGRLYYGVKGWN